MRSLRPWTHWTRKALARLTSSISTPQSYLQSKPWIPWRRKLPAISHPDQAAALRRGCSVACSTCPNPNCSALSGLAEMMISSKTPFSMSARLRQHPISQAGSHCKCTTMSCHVHRDDLELLCPPHVVSRAAIQCIVAVWHRRLFPARLEHSPVKWDTVLDCSLPAARPAASATQFVAPPQARHAQCTPCAVSNSVYSSQEGRCHAHLARH